MGGRVVLLLLCVLCVIAAANFVAATQFRGPFRVQGRCFCDTCNCGFETNRTTYIHRATVALECSDRVTGELRYKAFQDTDETGTYSFLVELDHGDDFCYVTPVSSPHPDCREHNPRRNRAEVVVTRNNGDVSPIRHANAVAFFKDRPLPGCAEFIRQLLASDG